MLERPTPSAPPPAGEELPKEIHLGRQPIMNWDHGIVAYELLFRAGAASNRADVLNPTQATAQVISHAFGELGIGGALGNNECFINLGKAMLMSDLIELLPKDRVVLEILEDVTMDAQLVARCRELRDQGFRLALDDFVYTPAYEPLLEFVEIVKVDLTLLSLDQVIDMPQRLPIGMRLLAEKVETHVEFEICLNNGYELFQGYYFARPQIISGRRNDAKRTSILRLIGLLASDAETKDLTKVFQQEPALCYNLFRLVNSVAMGAQTALTNIAEAITALGRRQLQRWLQLLLLAEAAGMSGQNPILNTAANRGRLMDTLARHLDIGDIRLHDMAFTTGLFSLLDAMLETTMVEALDEVNIHGDTRAALLHRAGRLGLLLRLCEALETADFVVAEILSQELGIESMALARMQVEAMRWSTSLGQAIAAQ